MQLQMNKEIAANYKSNSQKIRVITEHWFKNNGYCVNCGAVLRKYDNNRPVNDFHCNTCGEDYELKSKQGFSEKIVDGAYSTMIEKINENENPNFLFLSYEKSYQISNLVVIPKYFFLPDIIEKRKPLSERARRAGWIGCNINLKSIPESGRIFLIKNSEIINKNDVIEKFNQTIFLKKNNAESKSWIFDIMNIIDKLNKEEFELSELYAFEEYFKLRHPNNNNIKARIRRELQILRDNNYLNFVKRGKYRLKRLGLPVSEDV